MPTFYNAQRIREFCGSREISTLCHFTPIGNIKNILKDGLISRKTLLENNVDFWMTDRLRLDRYPKTVCLSIHSVNEEMFIKKQSEDECAWVILLIDASVLWTHDCHFCYTNAASSAIKYMRHKLHKAEALEMMFRDHPSVRGGCSSERAWVKRGENEPTDIQAEVQVFDPIHRDLIVELIVRDQLVEAEVIKLMGEVGERRPIRLCPEHFL